MRKKKNPPNGTAGAGKRYLRDLARGLSQSEVARKHNVTPQSVSRAVARARKAGAV